MKAATRTVATSQQLSPRLMRPLEYHVQGPDLLFGGNPSIQHDEQLFHLQTEKERSKELKMKMNMLEKENIDLKNDLTELVNSDPGEDDEDELIPVVSNKKK